MEGFIYLVPFILLSWFGTSFFFKAAGYAQWKAFVPVYNIIIWLKIIKKPTWWVFLSFIPVVNLVLFIGMVVELLNSFNYRNKALHVVGSVIPYIVLPYLGIKETLTYTGPIDYTNPKEKKSEVREWSEALFFAIIAATAIRAFVVEAFVIPTGSMERTLRVYDCLFVNKMSYGTRFTMTPLAVPFSHQTIIGTSIKSYTDKVKIPYFRFPSWEEIDNGDMVVFNYPQEDYHPIDKRSHYIKRCVGIAGDTLSINNAVISINGKEFENGDNYQISYDVWINTSKISMDEFFEAYQISPNDRVVHSIDSMGSKFNMAFPDKYISELKKLKAITKIEPAIKAFNTGQGEVFMENKSHAWTRDNFGPIFIPNEGSEIKLTDDNFDTYKRIIDVYENGSIYRKSELEKFKFGITQLKSRISSLDIHKIFVQGNRNLKSQPGNLSAIGSIYQLANAVKSNFYTVEVPGEILKLADQFYWKDNANYSDGDMKDNAKLYLNFLKENMDKQIAEYDELITEIESQESTEELFLINGQLTNTYQFKQDYFFMIGDNRHKSADSRAWGFVPEDHVVGKPVFVWMSLDDTKSGMSLSKIRWDRVCSFVTPTGLTRSFKFEVLFLILGWTAFNRLYWKKRKTKKNTAA